MEVQGTVHLTTFLTSHYSNFLFNRTGVGQGQSGCGLFPVVGIDFEVRIEGVSGPVNRGFLVNPRLTGPDTPSIRTRVFFFPVVGIDPP